jgi:PTS system nitrogen regulatory IIA component
VTEESFGLATLAKYLNRDARELERLAEKGGLPGKRISGQWRFNRGEVAEWVSQEMSGFSAQQLEAVESGASDTVSEDAGPNWSIRGLMSEELTAVPLLARTGNAVLPALVSLANASWRIWDAERVLASVKSREEVCSTALAGGVAIPHLRRPMADAFDAPMIAFGRTFSAVPFGGGGQTADIYFLILSVDDRQHLAVLARLARLIQTDGFLDQLRLAETPFETLDVIAEFESRLDG